MCISIILENFLNYNLQKINKCIASGVVYYTIISNLKTRVGQIIFINKRTIRKGIHFFSKTMSTKIKAKKQIWNMSSSIYFKNNLVLMLLLL